WINGYTRVAVTRLDILDSLETIGICTAYELPDGSRTDRMPLTPILARCRPVIEMVPGWGESTRNCRVWDDLPRAAQDYVQRIEVMVDAPAPFVSVGPRREETIVRS
ncbi:adenylosuccinate synthetase, partial [bacterium]|nr:adenylosuccinate synthetase [candidate division CSSED10-310 bacterium]